MKRLFQVLVLTLAANFVAAAGLVVWLHHEGRLDRERLMAIHGVLYPPATDPEPPAAPPPADPTTQPILRLEELLARSTGRTATEQVRFIQTAFDTQTAHLERRERELGDLQRQVELAKQLLARDRAALEAEKAELAAREEQSARLAADKGFQDSLQLYNTMPAKQVKNIFLALDDDTVMNYLQAMEPRAAARIVKEFKLPQEIDRIQRIMEMMRQSSATAQGNE